MTFSQSGEKATANIDTFNDVAGNQTYVDGSIFIDTTQNVNNRQLFSTTIIYIGSTGRQEVLVEGLQEAVRDAAHIPSWAVSQLETITRSQGQEVAVIALGNDNSLTQHSVSFQSDRFASDQLASPVQVWVFFIDIAITDLK